MRNFRIIRAAAGIALLGFASALYAFNPLTAKQDVYLYAVMHVSACELDKMKEGYWLSTIAKTDANTFHKTKYRNKVKKKFSKDRAFLERCKWTLHTFESFEERSDARKSRQKKRAALLKLGKVHAWRLRF